jgi:hypothetical protein
MKEKGSISSERHDKEFFLYIFMQTAEVKEEEEISLLFVQVTPFV